LRGVATDAGRFARVIRGKSIKTTISDKAAPCPLDHVNRQFKAPRRNVLRLSDFTYVATWTEFVYIPFVIDAYARRIVCWRLLALRTQVSCSTRWSRPARSPTDPSRPARAS
jgi:transposase InsO family protein